MGNLVEKKQVWGQTVDIYPGYVAGRTVVALGAGLKIDVAIDLQATILKSNCSFNATRIYIRVMML